MRYRPANSVGYATIDGVVALGIAATSIAFSQNHFIHLQGLSSHRINVADAGFGVLFVSGWQYCFYSLKLYDRFATLPSRTAAISKGVITMSFAVLVHLLVFHRALLHLRTTVILVCALLFYEVTRLYISDYVIDSFAARNPQHVLIVGSGRRAGKAWREIRTRYHASAVVFGFVDDRNPVECAPDIRSRYLGSVEDMTGLLLAHAIDIVLIAMPLQSSYHVMQRAVNIAEDVGVRVIYLNDIYSTTRRIEQSNRELFNELFPVHQDHIFRLGLKRAIDICVSSLGLLLLSPLFLIIGVAVRATSKGPSFFVQERLGYRRRRFQMVKFRTMILEAETRLLGLEEYDEALAPGLETRNDPQVTSIGGFLRKTSLNELPQLWNVLKGDMSLVGPRPMSIGDVALFSEASLMRRFSVKPGITGLWQVYDRDKLGFAHWVELDTRYIDRWSLALDFKIIGKTIVAVLSRSAAS